MYREENNGAPQLLNLPRFIWVNKSMSLAELHHFVFDYFKELFARYYTEEDLKNSIRVDPHWKHPDSGEELNAESVTQLFKDGDLEKQFKVFFSNLT